MRQYDNDMRNHCKKIAIKLFRLIYSVLFYCALPLILVRLLWRSRKLPGYRKRWGERFGFIDLPASAQHGVWIHSVSVGETVAAALLIKSIQQCYPDLPIVVTTMTVTGSERVKTLLGDTVFHRYVPYDLPCAVKRFLKCVQPKLLVLMETELWPNLLHYTHRASIPIVLANARLSEKSACNYERVSWVTQSMLSQLSCVAAQAKEDADRFCRLGADKNKVQITGNIKFDLSLPSNLETEAQALKKQLGEQRLIFIAASTREGEEVYILEAFARIKAKLPECLLLLVPRHPDRFSMVADLCRARGYQIALRSARQSCDEKTDIFLGDSMGEMLLFYRVSDVVFVGGSLLPYGGQNVLEPAVLGRAIIVGPHTFNFTEAVRLLKDAQAIEIVATADALADKVIRFLEDQALRSSYGDRAKQVVEKNRGAVAKHMVILKQLLL